MSFFLPENVSVNVPRMYVRIMLTFRAGTQKEQDKEDEEARRRAMRNLVNSWQERLQLISVIVRSSLTW